VKTRAAVFDLGSSSFHLLVCDAVDGGERLVPLLHRRAVLQLGASLGTSGSIPPDRASAAVAAAKRLRRALDSFGAEVVVALGTAALREATNGPEVVRRLERAISLRVKVLDGEEEARLCLVGQKASVWSGPGPVVGLDLGGGSLEVAMSDGDGLDLATSLPVGAARLRAELGAGDPMTEDHREQAWTRTCDVVSQVSSTVAAGKPGEKFSTCPSMPTRMSASTCGRLFCRSTSRSNVDLEFQSMALSRFRVPPPANLSAMSRRAKSTGCSVRDVCSART